ncbi:hypothetical protein O0235_10815 [Tepidiforma flava]|uniref:Uncharacterized protein n=1 Tax=Tepidiforma flava TaxID=3004094 RepID=A0ABY7MCE0_9CHLR|nr:hypothetical protein [Tepidiforma flava]WBL37585.1 hypothetical protein O0235_10815 [Tepidiforma flava]
MYSFISTNEGLFTCPRHPSPRPIPCVRHVFPLLEVAAQQHDITPPQLPPQPFAERPRLLLAR